MTTKHIAFGVLGALLIAIVVVFAGGTFGKDAQIGDMASTSVQQATSGTDVASSTQQAPGNATTTIDNPQRGTRVVTARLGEGTSALDATVTPLEVIEDSRCPSGVTCVWAGRARVKVRVQTAERTDEATLAVGETVRHGGLSVTLTNVTPYPEANIPIAPNQYRFSFAVQR